MNARNVVTVELLSLETGKPEKVDFNFGGGRYSPLMCEAFRDGRRMFGWNVLQAEAYARALGAEFGRVLVGDASVKFGKLNDDGKLNLKETLNIKGITITACLSIGLAMTKANELAKMGFTPTGFKIQSETVNKWLAELFKPVDEYIATMNAKREAAEKLAQETTVPVTTS